MAQAPKAGGIRGVVVAPKKRGRPPGKKTTKNNLALPSIGELWAKATDEQRQEMVASRTGLKLWSNITAALDKGLIYHPYIDKKGRLRHKMMPISIGERLHLWEKVLPYSVGQPRKTLPPKAEGPNDSLPAGAKVAPYMDRLRIALASGKRTLAERNVTSKPGESSPSEGGSNGDGKGEPGSVLQSPGVDSRPPDPGGPKN